MRAKITQVGPATQKCTMVPGVISKVMSCLNTISCKYTYVTEMKLICPRIVVDKVTKTSEVVNDGVYNVLWEGWGRVWQRAPYK